MYLLDGFLGVYYNVCHQNPNQVFPHTLSYSLTLQVYKLIQVIHVAHSCSDKPFSSPWLENNTSHDKQITNWSKIQTSTKHACQHQSIHYHQVPLQANRPDFQLKNTIIFTALTRVKVPLHWRIWTLFCYALYWNESVSRMCAFKKTMYWNEIKWMEKMLSTLCWHWVVKGENVPNVSSLYRKSL